MLRGSDLILHAGDIATLAVLEELRELGPPVEAVYGNADEPSLRQLLPKERVVEVGEARLGLVHIPGPAAGRHARLVARFPECDAIVYGHTHVAEATQVEGIWILNPGSPTERRLRSQSRSLLVLEVNGKVLQPQLVTLE